MTYKEKLLDPRWQRKRLEVLQSDNFTCSLCGKEDKTLHVHHFCYPESRNPWDSDLSDMTTLCSDCHFIDHYKCFTPLEKELIEDLQCYLMFGEKILIQKMNEIIIRHIKDKNGKPILR